MEHIRHTTTQHNTGDASRESFHPACIRYFTLFSMSPSLFHYRAWVLKPLYTLISTEFVSAIVLNHKKAIPLFIINVIFSSTILQLVPRQHHLLQCRQCTESFKVLLLLHPLSKHPTEVFKVTCRRNDPWCSQTPTTDSCVQCHSSDASHSGIHISVHLKKQHYRQYLFGTIISLKLLHISCDTKVILQKYFNSLSAKSLFSPIDHSKMNVCVRSTCVYRDLFN